MPKKNPVKINRVNVLVYPRFGKPRGTQHYDAKWMRAANETASNRHAVMVVVGWNDPDFSARGFELLLRARQKLGRRLIVLREKNLDDGLKPILKVRGLALDKKSLQVIGMGQHFANDASMCVGTIGRSVANDLKAKKFYVDKRRSIRDPFSLLQEEIFRANPRLAREAAKKEGPKEFWEATLERLTKFTKRGLVQYGTIARIAKRAKTFGGLLENARVAAEQRMLNPDFNSRLSVEELDDLIDFSGGNWMVRAFRALTEIRARKSRARKPRAQ